ncbi:efflux RND transporter permease subunit [Paramaledivibacter caminithermalis]|uniref:Hydrophobic/amphiphilic exporter-1, HAE1 family n=1 Tax=Paramaledivibacter caminithermalis (strain DSM 15212 / CIP 107654 / DViRD3) TaxID=1121301 RepID=A0A1M6RQ73_PARC5|nr:efflux RND transporter permease subunit [Paramaledivibacter caminithermalis]SHK34609.1 hydrophobic/amphiphilic exporter-1, HAE1 family [Paramaledivibacter caminithermalis DSM 15212]
MNLSKIAVKRPVTIVMITFMIIILGVVSLTKLPIDLFPEIEVPIAIVSTSYSGVGSQEMEELVTKPIEEAIATVSDIENVRSISSEGSSIVVAEFAFGTDMDFATLDMREKVDMVKGLLPEEAGTPMVLKIDPNAFPIIQLSLSNGGDLAKLQVIGEDSIKPKLERLPGVASVDVSGGKENQIEVVVNMEKLNGYGLTIDRLSQILRAENLNLPGGEVKKGKQKLTIRTMGEFQSVEEISSLPITLPSGGIVYLSDIADVNMNYKEVESIVKTNGKNSINISIQKQSGTNTVKVADRVNQELEKLKNEFPDIEINVVMDQSEFIKQSIDNVIKNAIVGAVLAIFILYLFLRNVRTTFIIGTAIPISIIATFILIYFYGITLNMMTLGGLALGVGMLVDNAIVVLENIYRFRQEGYSRKEAAIKGAQEVGMAVTASTLTTVAVFLPMVFVEGITSAIFKEFSLSVAMSLGASLIVSLTLIPMLCSKFLKVDRMQGKKHHGRFRLFDFLYDSFDKIFAKVESIYKKILNWAIGHRKSTVAIAIAIFITSMASAVMVGAEFFPETDEGQFTVNISLPEGSKLESTHEVVLEIEDSIKNIKEVETIFSTIGSTGRRFSSSNSSNTGSVYVVLKDLKDRKRSTSEVADEVRKMVMDIPGAEVGVEVTSQGMGGGTGAPISVDIKGDDLDELKKIADDLKTSIEGIEGTREVKSSFGEGIPEVQIKIKRKNASQYGLTSAQIASSIKGTILGQTATRYKFDGEEIDVVIKGDSIFKESISNLGQTSIKTPMGIDVPLNQIADISIDRGPVTINRDDQVRTVSVTSQIMGRDLGSITKDIEKVLSQYPMPEGYSYDISGQNEDMMESFEDLFMALLLAIVLVYMVIASQFESLIHPFTIMFSVPLAVSGGMFGLFITGRSLSVPAFIGIIMLAGIVVNNAIVLVDYINTRRTNGENRKEAIINAGPIRLRPILMTTLTTVLGLLPLALGIGEGAETQAPMATVVIGGLLLSTLLTLVFIPVLYTIFDDFNDFLKKKFFKNKSVRV